MSLVVSPSLLVASVISVVENSVHLADAPVEIAIVLHGVTSDVISDRDLLRTDRPVIEIKFVAENVARNNFDAVNT